MRNYHEPWYSFDVENVWLLQTLRKENICSETALSVTLQSKGLFDTRKKKPWSSNLQQWTEFPWSARLLNLSSPGSFSVPWTSFMSVFESASVNLQWIGRDEKVEVRTILIYIRREIYVFSGSIIWFSIVAFLHTWNLQTKEFSLMTM